MARIRKPSGSKRSNRQRKGRSADRLARREGNKIGRSSLLIVCEGTQTEPRYFDSLRKHLKLSTVEVVVETSQHDTAPIRVVERAVRLRKKRSEDAQKSTIQAAYDEVWCVIDTENLQLNQTFQRAVSKARKEKLNLAISVPCFEFWYLLHFEVTTKAFGDGREVKNALKRHIAGYNESLEVFKHLYPKTTQAIEHATRLLKQHPDDSQHPNPSTCVHILVQSIWNMKS